MAKPLPINRDLVKALFLKGIAPSEIAPQFGVTPNQIRVWASRGKWVAERESQPQTQSVAIQDVAAEFANRTVSIARRLITKLEELPVQSLRDTKDCSAALASTYATARKALGIDDANAVQQHLHYHVMRDCRSSFAQGAVVDVEAAVASTAKPAAEQSAAPSAPSQAPDDASQPPT